MICRDNPDEFKQRLEYRCRFSAVTVSQQSLEQISETQKETADRF